MNRMNAVNEDTFYSVHFSSAHMQSIYKFVFLFSSQIVFGSRNTSKATLQQWKAVDLSY